MSKKQRNKDTRPGASAVISDGTIHGAAPPALHNPPARKNAAAKHKPDAFSAWLDRALPRLQEQLADVVNIEVTAPIDKLKN